MSKTPLREKYPHMRRTGYFFIDRRLILHQPAVAQAIHACMIVLDAEGYEGRTASDLGGIRYLAISALFEEVPLTVPTLNSPYYELSLVPDVPEDRRPGIVLSVAGERMRAVAERKTEAEAPKLISLH